MSASNRSSSHDSTVAQSSSAHVGAPSSVHRIELQELHLTEADLPAAITDQGIVKGYLQDASRVVGHAEALYRPANTREVAMVLRSLHAANTPVTVVARQTATTASAVPMGGAVLSMEKLQALLWHRGDRARAQGGILLGEFQRTLEQQGWLYPPDPTSRNESTLGASVACNASGARTFKYGPTRPYVVGLQVVLPEGYVLELQRGQVLADARGILELQFPDGQIRQLPVPDYRQPAVKHAAGYHSGAPLDLIDLFIGSEGTLGVITEVEVRLLPLPARTMSLMAFFPDEPTAFGFVRAARGQQVQELDPGLTENLSPRCLEWFDVNALNILRHRYADLNLPAEARAAVFFEQECTEDTESDLLEAWYNLLMSTGALVEAENGVMVADSDARQQLLYELRHAVPAGVNEQAARNRMPKVGTDLAVPDEHLEAIMNVYARGVSDLPGSLGDVDCVRVLAQLVQEPLSEPLSTELKSPQAASSPAFQSLVERLETRMGVEPAKSASLSERVQTLWQKRGLPRQLEFATFGHIGNNHVHVNLLPRTQDELVAARQLYYRWTLEAIAMGGTVSAEHGIGKIKRSMLEALLGPDAIEQMQRVKQQLDPHGILGVGNLFEKPLPPLPEAS